MSTETFVTITSILPNTKTPIVRNPDVKTNEATAPVVDAGRQEIAVGSIVSSKDQPVDSVAESRVSVPSEDQLESAVDDINSYVQTVSRKLQFTVDDSLPLGRMVIKVIDSDTNEVIREIPSAEALALAERINEQLEGTARFDGLVFTDQA